MAVIFTRLPKTLLRIGILASTCFLLIACSGGSSSENNASSKQAVEHPVNAPTAENSVATGEVDSQNSPAKEIYTRPRIFPKMKSLPLQFISTSGGQQLGVYVTLPADKKGNPAPGPFPVILVQSGYNTAILGTLPGSGGALFGAPDPFFVKRGYAIVSVDVLGTGVSGGGWELFGANEQAAYGDAVDWVHTQPWFNGKLGVAGVSYMAISALFTAIERPDAVDAVFASQVVGDAKRGTMGTGGMLNGLFMSKWVIVTQLLSALDLPAILRSPGDYATIVAHSREHVDQIDNFYLPLIEDALNGESYIAYDSNFWRERSPLERLDQVQAPTLITGNIYDIFQRDEPLVYEALKDHTDSRLVIYDGDHTTSVVNALNGNSKVDPMVNLMLRWFDHYLMGMDSKIEEIPPVTQFVKNYKKPASQSYITATDWPHPQAEPDRWYLRGDKSLTRDRPEDSEANHSVKTPPMEQITYGKNKGGYLLQFALKMNDGTACSPSYRQWTLGAGGLLKPNCSGDIRKLEKKAINYESDPLSEDYYINGPIQADIWMETTAHEAVLSVRIDEVNSETGRVYQITNGLLLASQRAVDESRSRFVEGEMIQPYHYFSEETAVPVEPGEIFKMQVEVFPTSAIIKKGNKLRISLSASNQAQGVLNYVQQERARDGITTIHHSSEYPSSVVLPIVPLSALN